VAVRVEAVAILDVLASLLETVAVTVPRGRWVEPGIGAARRRAARVAGRRASRARNRASAGVAAVAAGTPAIRAAVVGI